MKILLLISTALVLTNSSFAAEEVKKPEAPKKMVVSSQTASLRTEPKEYIAGQEQDEQASKAVFGRSYELFKKLLAPAYRDPLQDSQLLYNEQILCLQELPNDWLKVEALEQYVFNKKEKKWQHLQGYIKKQQAIAIENFVVPNIVVCKPTAKASCFYECSVKLPVGTKLHGIETLQNSYRITLLDGRIGYISDHDVRPLEKHINASIDLRTDIVGDSKELIGEPYNWGGRSFHCDCSGLINELYRCNSIEIPRNANPMYLKCNKITNGSDLNPGDCIFLAYPDHPENIYHVLMYIGNDQVLETRSVSHGVAIANAKNRFGKSLSQLKSGDSIKEQIEDSQENIIAFGSFLNDPSLVQELNAYALGQTEIPEKLAD